MSGSIANIDLSTLTLEQLRTLRDRIEKTLEIHRFEEGLNQAVKEYRDRDPHVIRL